VTQLGVNGGSQRGLDLAETMRVSRLARDLHRWLRMTRQRDGRRRQRVWLLLANLVLCSLPSVAIAADGGTEAARFVGGCCGHMAAVAAEGVVRGIVRDGVRSSPRRSGSPQHRGPTLEERCFVDDDSAACLEEAARIAQDGRDDANHRAFAYVDRACWITGDASPCDQALSLQAALESGSDATPRL
jgi:hypothetical protein